MREIFLGEYIKQKRLELGLTQEQLCEGLCEPMTISRLENGRQTPSRNLINALLQRLGLPDDRYFALLSKNEMEIEKLQKEITSCNVQCDQLVGPEKAQIIEQGRERILALERIAEKDDRITQQFILRTKVLLGKAEGSYSLEEQLEMLMEAIRLTVPRFDLEEINRSLYSFNEVKIIVQIANVYSGHGQHKKAIDIFSQLLKYVQKHYPNILQSGGLLPMVSYSYARELDLGRRYEDAIEIAELGWQSCVKSGHYQSLPGLIHIMGECYHLLGDDEKSENLYRQAYYLYQAIDNMRDLAILKTEVQQYLGLNFDTQ